MNCLNIYYNNRNWGQKLQNNGFEKGVKWEKVMIERAKRYLCKHPYQAVYIVHKVYGISEYKKEKIFADYFVVCGSKRKETETNELMVPGATRVCEFMISRDCINEYKNDYKNQFMDYYVKKNHSYPIHIHSFNNKYKFTTIAWLD